MVLALLFCLLTLLPLSLGNDVPVVNCARIPPSLWCKSKEIAAKCGVADQCAKYEQESRNQKIQLTLLYEGLCPDCQEFITGPLYNDIYVKFSNYVDIELVPYGNAELLENGTIICQHGQKECEVNLYESCAIHFIADPLPFIYCLEKKIEMGATLDKAAESCYSKLHISHVEYDQILHCVKTKKGNDLQIEAAKRTQSAYPDQHTYVPWIFINNVSLANSQYIARNVPQFICDSFVGKNVPDVCGGLGKQ